MYGSLAFFRRYSVENGVLEAKKWLSELNGKNVPLKLFSAHYDRASGNGGQNVNKVNSKCTLTLNDFSSCKWFPDEIRRQMLEHRFRYYASAKDALVIQSGETRSREQNKRICVEKLVKEIKECAYFPEETGELKKEKWVNIKVKENEKRLKNKKLRAEKRKSRSVKFDF